MWQVPQHKNIELKDKEAHVWLVNKSAHIKNFNIYWTLLNKEEQEKANAFRFKKDKDCYVIARGVLRILLGNYLGKSPNTIVFQYLINSKPSVVNDKNLEFNISHSEDCILMAFLQDFVVGIDVEYTKRPVELENIARSFFSEEEVKELFTLDKSYHLQAFYNCWTRKEAFIKALGDGLSFPLDKFVVSLSSAKEASLLETKWDKEEKEKWILNAIKVQENYIGAIAIKGNINKIDYFYFN